MSALASPSFRLYVLGAFFALNGLWIQRVTLAWLAWSLTGSAAWVGAVAGALYAPTLLAGPVFGVLADRIDLRRGALATQSLLALFTAALLALWSAGALGPGGLFLSALAIGVVWSAHHPIRMALIPRLVPPEALAQAVAVGSINFNLSRMLGPALAGVLLAASGAEAALAANLLCLAPFLLMLLILRVDAAPRAAPSRAPFWRALGGDLREGFGFALRHPTIRLAMLGTAAFALIARAPLEITAAIADGAFSAGARGLGEATSAAGFGALLAAAALARRRGSDPTALVRIGALSLAGAAALGVILSATSAWPLALLLFAAMGFCASTAGVGFQSAVQLSIPDSHRGRVMSLWTLLGIGGAAVGAALLGLAGDLLGVRGALAALGLGGLAALSVATLARRFDAAPPPRQGAPASPRSGASD